MKNILEYLGYHTKIEYDAESAVLYGKIEGIKDLVNFESDSAEAIEQEFRNAVDDYLAFCKEVGKDPDKEYKGLFNVRISPELHKKLAILSFKTEESLNSIVEASIAQYLASQSTYDDYEVAQSETVTFSAAKVIDLSKHFVKDKQKIQMNPISDLEEM